MGDHGTAAFAKEDREDAARRRPSGSLQDYAVQRGLEFRDRASLAGFRRALPAFPEEQFNLMRGVLPRGRFGILLHELLQTHGPGTALPGTFYAVRESSDEGFLRSLIPDRTNIPIIGNFLDPAPSKDPPKAFAGQGAWSPVTTAATPVPETVSRLPIVALTVASRAPLIDSAANRDLGPLGVPGWRAQSSAGIEAERLAPLLTPAVAAALAPLTGLPYARAVIDHGMLVVKRNGFVMDPATLDAFAETTCALGDALAAACLGDRRPVPLAQHLAPCPWSDDARVVQHGLPKAWENDFRAFATQRGLALEDPADWHERHPTVPLPGRVLAVMRAPDGLRLLFTTDVPVEGPRAVRGAIAFPVAPGTPPTPPGGIANADAGTTTAVAGDVAVVWTHRWFGYAREADTLREDALSAARAAGFTPAFG